MMDIESMIKDFKNQYNEVYVTNLNGEDYVWRTLTRKEYREITEYAISEDDAHERICNLCILHPKRNYATSVKAYVPTRIAPQILAESGYSDTRKEFILLDIFRQQLNQFEAQAEIIINFAFPNISFEEMENWTKEKLIKYLAKADWQLKNIRGIKHMNIVNPFTDADETEVPEEEPFDIMKLANDLRQQGQDPMFVLKEFYLSEKRDFVERPFIGGLKQVDNIIAGLDAFKKGVHQNGRYEIIRQQVQTISEKRRRHLS